MSGQSDPVPEVYGAEAYTSPDYARAEGEKLWPHVWQQVCRLEELPDVGDYVTYDIMNDSIIVVRSAIDTISAFYNVCAHRGKRLTEGCGSVDQFRCSFHGWKYDLTGRCTWVLDPEDWGDRLTEERLKIPDVKVDTWGGWVFINMDPDAGPLREFLEPAATVLDPYQFERMRYRWRQWFVFDCNWKIALEAFIEAYHVEGTHPQLMKVGDYDMVSSKHGLHGNNAFAPAKDSSGSADASTINRAGKGDDPRAATAALQIETWETVNARTTETLVKAAQRLVDELPADTPSPAVVAHWLKSAQADDAARGVLWPEITPEQLAAAGSSWHIFPNMLIAQAQTNALVYRMRPYRDDPEKCIFEGCVIELFPEGEEPVTEWIESDPGDFEAWRLVLSQDFHNMREVQRGVRSRGFRGCIPSPKQEQTVINLHRNLARYMDGVGAPRPL